MILGVPQNDRIPFTTPPVAQNQFNPRAIDTGYKSHLNPFWRVMPPMMARGFRPPLPPTAMPGSSRRGNQYMAQMEAVNVQPPSATSMPTNTKGWGFGYFGADPAAVAPAAAPAAPVPAPSSTMARTPGRRHGGLSPYMLMREGLFPSIKSVSALNQLAMLQAKQAQNLVPYGRR